MQMLLFPDPASPQGAKTADAAFSDGDLQALSALLATLHRQIVAVDGEGEGLRADAAADLRL